MDAPRLLIVEDDELIGSSLSRALDASGYEAHLAADLGTARRWLAANNPQLVLLDLSLPDGDGLDLCVELRRSHPTTPVVMLTSRTSELDVVNGLNVGAVDYVAKPFRLAELLARVASHLRFASQQAASTPPPAPAAPALSVEERIVHLDDLAIDFEARRVWLSGDEISLRPKEFDLLARLAREPGVVVRRDQLIADVWDEHWWGPTKTLDVHINALRRHFGEGSEGSRITTIRGVGYRLDVP